MNKIKHFKFLHFNENNPIDIELILPQCEQENYIQLMAMEIIAKTYKKRQHCMKFKKTK